MAESEILAKLQWADPESHEIREYLLLEGATATIGRSSNNDIQIAEHHVSRQHAVISYRDGIFMINDLGSSNGTFVNDNRVTEPYPLFAGDEIRLFVPMLRFLAIDSAEALEIEGATTLGAPSGQSMLIVTNGPQEGQNIPLLIDQLTVGRATANATWEILLQDPSVSRPHARLERRDNQWHLIDLGSSNGTRINNTVTVDQNGYVLRDGDTIELGGSVLLFRTGWTAQINETNANPTKPRRP